MCINPITLSSTNQVNPFDYVPAASTLRGLYQIFCAYAPPAEQTVSLKEHSYSLLSGGKSWRSYVMLLPFLGNAVLLLHDYLYDGSPSDQDILSFLLRMEPFADPKLQKLLNHTKSLCQRNFDITIPSMKKLKQEWENLQNDLYCEQLSKQDLGQLSDKNIQTLLAIATTQVENVSQKIVALKREKHLLAAGPLRNARTYYEVLTYAYQGNEKAVKAFIKLGQEDREIHKVQKVRVPQSQAAQEMSALLNMLQKDATDLKFSFDKNTRKYVAKNGSGKVLCKDFQKLMRTVDWSQVVLEDEGFNLSTFFDIATNLLTKGRLFSDPTLKEGEYKAVHNEYCADSYKGINMLLRCLSFSFDENGRLKSSAQAVDSTTESAHIDYTVKRYLPIAAKAILGLSKLPDYKEKYRKYVWRGESCSPESYTAELQRRINALGKKPEPCLGFTSTSATNLMESFSGNCLTLLRNEGGGKDVRERSPLKHEQEILFLPTTQVQWQYHKEIRGGHLFLARTVPTSAPQERGIG